MSVTVWSCSLFPKLNNIKFDETEKPHKLATTQLIEKEGILKDWNDAQKYCNRANSIFRIEQAVITLLLILALVMYIINNTKFVAPSPLFSRICIASLVTTPFIIGLYLYHRKNYLDQLTAMLKRMNQNGYNNYLHKTFVPNLAQIHLEFGIVKKRSYDTVSSVFNRL